MPILARSSAAPPPWALYAAVLGGGMLGGSTRYVIGLAIPAQPGQLPWAILGINLAGALVLGALLGGWARRGHVTHPWRPFLATGLLGSFTTWSTFMADTLGLARAGRIGLALAYLVGATALGVVAAAAGWGLAQRAVPPAGTVVADGSRA
ncbi:MAG TPA: CrcB family protein [Candidatus Nanopelagicales bacterium]